MSDFEPGKEEKNRECVLSIHVKLDSFTEVKSSRGNVTMIGFHGEAESPYFHGEVLPGGVDTQCQKPGGPRRLSARYILQGTDLQGKACRIFIENNGEDKGEGLRTTPMLLTDSEAIAWLQTAALEGQIDGEEGGICVSIWEKVAAFERTELIISKGDPSQGGKTIYGELYKPCGSADRYPTIIASHGYNGSSGQMRSEMEELAKRGIACYCFDFCGGSNTTVSSGSTTQMTIRTEQQDLRDVVEYIEKLPWVDKDQLYLYGTGQGGFVAGLTAPEFTDRIRGMFLNFPTFCIPDHWRDRRPENTPETFEFLGTTLGRCFVEDIPRHDVIEHAAKYAGEVHIFHGSEDPVVLLEYSERLIQAYPNADLTVYPGQGHGFEERFIKATAGKIASLIFG